MAKMHEICQISRRQNRPSFAFVLHAAACSDLTLDLLHSSLVDSPPLVANESRNVNNEEKFSHRAHQDGVEEVERTIDVEKQDRDMPDA